MHRLPAADRARWRSATRSSSTSSRWSWASAPAASTFCTRTSLAAWARSAARRARHEAPVHAAAARRPSRRGGRTRRGAAARHAGRLLLAPQPGRAGLRRTRRGRFGSPTSSSPAARSPSRSPTRSGRCGQRGLLEVSVAPGAVVDGDARLRVAAGRRSSGAARARSTPSCARSGPGSPAPARDRATAGWRSPPPRTLRWRSEPPRSSPRGSRSRRRGDRHRGLSHHTSAILAFCLGPSRRMARRVAPVPGIPALEPVDTGGWEDGCAGLPLAHMGRGPADDPWFFAAAFAAGRLARGAAPR